MSVIDILPNCVSSVYFMYDKNWERFSLGKVSLEPILDVKFWIDRDNMKVECTTGDITSSRNQRSWRSGNVFNVYGSVIVFLSIRRC